MKAPQTGGCQHGKLRYEITEEPQSVYTYHCLDWQRLTRTKFSLWIVVPRSGFHLTGLSHVNFNALPVVDTLTSDWFARTRSCICGRGMV